MNFLASIVVVTNLGFTAAFDTMRHCPAWVAYDLDPSEVVSTPRVPLAFSADGRIAGTDLDGDYRGSGYDRGHLAPAADFNWSSAALRETYYYSNICPQMPAVNRGRWLEIEKELRGLAASGTVHIVTFPWGFERGRAIGRVDVPDRLVKVAYGWFGIRFYDVENASGGGSD